MQGNNGDTLRQQLHTRFDQWLDILQQQWHEPPATLLEVTATVWDLRQQLTGGITETMVAQVHRSEHDRTQVHCTQCDGMLRAREFVCRTVETLVGPVQIERPYFYCRACRVGRYPCDEALGVVAGSKQLDRHKAAANLVTEVPYDTAQALFRELTGIPLGSERLPGRAGGCPTSPPTDPYVRNERIRFLGNPSLGTTLVHHCAALQAVQMLWTIWGMGRTSVASTF